MSLSPPLPGSRSAPLNEIHLQLAGAVDIAVTGALRSRVLAATPTPRDARLVLDLAAVTLLDASAMSVIAAAAQAYGEVELRNPCPVTRRVLEIGGLAHVVRIC